MESLEPGDFLYQSDQELFLVVVEEKNDSFLLAAHGWRDIDKERVDEYIEDSKSRVHRAEEMERLIEEKGSDETREQFEKLKELFEAYEDVELEENGPQTDFALDET